MSVYGVDVRLRNARLFRSLEWQSKSALKSIGALEHAPLVSIRKWSISLVVLLLVGGLDSFDAAAVRAGCTESTDTALRGLPGALLADLKALPSRENGWLLLAGTAATLLVYSIEDHDRAQEALDQGALDTLSDLGNIWGDMRVLVPLSVGSWAIGGAIGNNRLAGLGYDASRGLLLTYTVTGLLKHAVNRTRPNGDDLSFPSGHSAAAWTVAGVVQRRCGGWPGGIAIGLAVLTGAGRIEDYKHYASDVVAGAFIGWIIGRTVARPRGVDQSAWRLVPTGNGLAVVASF